MLMCHGKFGAERSGVAEHVEAADQALVGAVLVNAVEVAGAEVGKRSSALQHGGKRRSASPVTLAVVEQRANVALAVAAQLAQSAARCLAFFGSEFVRHDGVLGPACDPAQGFACLLVVARGYA